MFAFVKRLLAPVTDDPVCDTRETWFSSLPWDSGERVAESVHGSNEARLAAALAQRVAELADKARERRLRHEGRRPQPLVELILRDRPRTGFDEYAQQIVGL